jgi:outer membrane protein assembly factor BamB
MRRFRPVAWSAAVLVGWVGLPYAWCRSLSQWWLYGRGAPMTWPAATGLLALAVLGLMVWLTAGRATRRSHPFFTVVILAGWCLTNALLWQGMASPLVRDTGFAAVFVASTLWLFWLWAMFFASGRWPARLGVHVAALALAVMLPACARADGADGNGRPLLVWRFAETKRSFSGPNPDDGQAGGPDHATANGLGPSLSAYRPDDLAGEYPCFRGRDGLAVVADARLARDWTRLPPHQVWRRPVGAGWGGFAVSGGCVYTQEQNGEDEVVVCYDLADGRQIWSHADEGWFRSGTAGDGPRATPNVTGQNVYTLGATGRLNCLDRTNGTCRWTIDVLADNGAGNLFHGLSGSPLVVDGLVIVSAGRRDGKSLAAYDCQTGNCVWRSGDDAAGYSSPQLCRLAEHDQIVVLNRSTLVGHDPRTGRVLWSFPWENSTGTNCSQSVPLGRRRIFVSSGYGKGCGVLELTPNVAGDWPVRPVWTNRNLRTKFTSAVARDGFMYGLDEGVLCCIDLADGTRRWRAGRYGDGQLLLAGDKLVVQAESGGVALVAAAPDAWREFARFAALADKTWNHPALAGRLLLVRNDREAACYELPGLVSGEE